MDSYWGLILSTAKANVVYAFVVMLGSLTLVYRKRRLLSVDVARTAESLSYGDKKATSINKGRNPGEWTPVRFTYPPITACTLDISEIKPIAYRPFRGGEHHVTMGIRPMPWNEWIEIDNQYEAYHRIRAHRIRTRGKGAICVLPETPGKVESGREAAIELVHEVAEYLSRRHPKTFHVERHSDEGQGYGWEGAAAIKKVTIVPLGETYELPLTAPDISTAEKALEVAAHLVQEDLAVMIEGTDGKYYFQAGVICVPGFWRMKEKIGLPLEEIHLSGNVPRYETKLQKSMERYFQRLGVDKPVVRENYSIQVVKKEGEEEDIDAEELAWSYSTNGGEDEEGSGRHKTFAKATESNMRLRVERQTLRRMGRTGAIIFGIRTYLSKISEMKEEEKEKLGESLEGWGEDIKEYKGRWRGDWWEMITKTNKD